MGGRNAGDGASRLVAGEMTRILLPERVGLSSMKINAILQEVIKKANRNLFNYTNLRIQRKKKYLVL